MRFLTLHLRPVPWPPFQLLLLSLVVVLASTGCGTLENESQQSPGNPDSSTWGGDTSSADSWGGGADASADSVGGNTNVSLGGAQDFGYFRRLLQDNIIPSPTDVDAAGFFAEHHTPLPEPVCGERICLQAMMGVMGNLINGNNCTMLQVGLNSPIVADPDNRPPLQLAVVIDISGSMEADGKLNFVRQGLQRLLLELDDEDEVTIITYSTRARVEIPLTALEGNRNTLLDIVNGLSAEGSTNIYAGLESGYQELYDNYDPARQNRLILLSDGIATAGVTNSSDIISMSKIYNSDGIGLTTVGLGSDFNYDLMRTLSEQADGNFYFVEDASAVDEVFTQELSYFTVPVAFDVEIVVEEGQYYDFRDAYGSNLWQDTENGGHLSVPSVFLAHRTSHSDVTPGEERRGGGSALLLELMPRPEAPEGAADSDIATIHFSFRDPSTNEIVQDTVVMNYPFAANHLSVEGYFDNEVVTKSFVVLNILVALQEACLLAHSNRPDEAIALLRRVIAAAEDYEDSANDGMGDVDIQLDVELMEQLIDVIVDNGTPEPEFVDIPENPWPRD